MSGAGTAIGLAAESFAAQPSVAWVAVGLVGLAAIGLGRLWRRALVRAGHRETEVRPLQIALASAEARLASEGDIQARFVGDLARQLQAPLAGMVARTEQVATGCADASVARRAVAVAEDMRHLSGLIDSFLKLTRPGSREDNSHHVPVHFHDLVLAAMSRCKALSITRGVSVLPTLSEVGGASVEVLGDAVLLEAMIENLVRNALLSAPTGSRVNLQVRVQSNALILSVHDPSATLDEVAVAAAMTGYFEVQEPPRPSGMGLSLAICRRVAEHHRGTMSFRSVPAGGCEFEVQLPIWRPDGAPAGPLLRVLPRTT